MTVGAERELREEIGELRCMLADLQKMVALALPEGRAHEWPKAAVSQRYLRARHIAELLGVSQTSVWRMAREGRIPAPHRLGHGMTVWDRQEVDAWQEERAGLGML